MKDPIQLPAQIIDRLPVRFTYNNNYYNDIFQGIPKYGYTAIFNKLLQNVDVKLQVDYLNNREYFNMKAKSVIYTGPIDAYYDYCYGDLQYRSLYFKHEKLDIDNYQGTSVINYINIDIPHTRIIEHKHFDINNKTNST